MPSTRSAPRSASRVPAAGEPDFTAWLADLPDDALVRLCEVRPDVATPPPTSLGVLASRLRLPASTARALAGLNQPALLVLAVAAALGADSGPVPLGAVGGRLGVDDDDPDLTRTIEQLRERALIWGETTHVRIAAVTASAVENAPVVAPHPDEPTGDALEGVWARLPQRAVGVLEAIARGRAPVGELGPGASQGVREAATALADAGLVSVVGASAGGDRIDGDGTGGDHDGDGAPARAAAGTTVIPHAHALDRARHGPRPTGQSLLTRPDHAGATPKAGATRSTTSAAREIDAAGGVDALDLLHQCDAVLAALSTVPASTLKAGGVGVRELRRVSRAAGIDEADLPLLLEVLAAAGLIAVGDTDVGDTPFDSVWAPTEAADIWGSRDSARRWADLVVAWWSMPAAAWRVGESPEGGGTLPALAEHTGPHAPAERVRVLRALAGVAPGHTPDGSALDEVVRWSSPIWFSRVGSAPVNGTVSEARRLGLVVVTEATTTARHLASRADYPGPGGAAPVAAEDLVDDLAAALPDPVSEVIVQADLTVLAPGPLTPDLAAEFALLADVESAGAATTYRITEATLRRALDAGRTAGGIRDLLTRTSVTPVPQSLDYLVDDVARRHGRLRVGTALSFLRCDDPSLVAQVLGSPAAERCALRAVAPTVLVSQARPLDVVDALREHGFAPVVEDTDGAVVALARPAARVKPSTTGRAPRVPARTATRSELLAAVTAMRAADRAKSAGGDGGPAHTGEAAVARLHEAARAGSPVTVAVVDAQGRSTARLIVPAAVGGGRVEGIEPDSAEAVTLPLHRVISVTDVDPTR